MYKEIPLQRFVLPSDKKFEYYSSLFYSGDFINTEKYWLAESGERVSFASYFNAFSLKKWKQYTNIASFSFEFEIVGNFKIKLYDCKIISDLGAQTVNSRLVKSETFECKDRKKVKVEIPETDADIVWVDIVALTNCYFYNGTIIGEIEDSNINNVVLSIATTTYKKEKFIIKNVELIKQQIFSDDSISENIFLHVVDNGKTLTNEQISGKHIYLHQNNNVGGSGGFARGMIETLRQTTKASHILVMDDDVLIMPESIKRTYYLLSSIKPEYKNFYISGAMLYYEKMNVLHEDIGFVNEDGEYEPVKKHYDLSDFIEAAKCEYADVKRQNKYAAWWYCCIPMNDVSYNDLPLPLFVRGDDVEFSLRHKAEFITLNGISIWHVGFASKFNGAMEFYQVIRNSLAIKAFSDICNSTDFIKRIYLKTRVELLRFNYDGAELYLEAVEDYMKGPAFFYEPVGDKIIAEKSKKNEKMLPISEYKGIEYDKNELYSKDNRSFLQKIIYKVSYNGIYLPDAALKNDPETIAYDWAYTPERYYLRKKLIAINPVKDEAALRNFDRKRAKKILRRLKKDFKILNKNKDNLKRKYQESGKYIKSIEFWDKYLKLN